MTSQKHSVKKYALKELITHLFLPILVQTSYLFSILSIRKAMFFFAIKQIAND